MKVKKRTEDDIEKEMKKETGKGKQKEGKKIDKKEEGRKRKISNVQK